MKIEFHRAPAIATIANRSIILIEQPDPRRLTPCWLGEDVPSPDLAKEAPRLAFFADPDPPRLGRFADPVLDHIELLLARRLFTHLLFTRLLPAALVSPLLPPFGAALVDCRTLDVGAAGSRIGFPRRGAPVVSLFNGLRGLRRRGRRGRYVVVGGYVDGLLFFGGRRFGRRSCHLCGLRGLWLSLLRLSLLLLCPRGI